MTTGEEVMGFVWEKIRGGGDEGVLGWKGWRGLGWGRRRGMGFLGFFLPRGTNLVATSTLNGPMDEKI